jgi:hypothetical protein
MSRPSEVVLDAVGECTSKWGIKNDFIDVV